MITRQPLNQTEESALQQQRTGAAPRSQRGSISPLAQLAQIEKARIAAQRAGRLRTGSDVFALEAFIPAFAPPNRKPDTPARRTERPHNTIRSAAAVTGHAKAIDLALREFTARRVRSAAMASARGEQAAFAADQAAGQEGMSWAAVLAQELPSQSRLGEHARRTGPALLATTLVTAGLVFAGTVQTKSVDAYTAAAVGLRTADTDASRNATTTSAPSSQPITDAPAATTAPVSADALPVGLPDSGTLVAETPAVEVSPDETASVQAAVVAQAAAAAVIETPVSEAPPVTAAPLGWATPTPGASLSSRFGNRTNPVTGRYALHAGVDFAASSGTPIHAVSGGVVTQAGWESGYGNYTCIKHSSSVTTCYGHQSKINVRVGQTVDRDQVIGLVGNTGNSTGSHLHFEVRVNGTPVNPLPYL